MKQKWVVDWAYVDSVILADGIEDGLGDCGRMNVASHMIGSLQGGKQSARIRSMSCNYSRLILRELVRKQHWKALINNVIKYTIIHENFITIIYI